jgi:collagen type VII alpha
MALITLTVDSNWSTCSNGLNTGGPPGAGDDINLNGRGLNLDVGSPANTFICNSITASGTNGTINLPNATTTIGVTTLTAGSTVLITMATGQTLTVSGNIVTSATPNKFAISVTGGNNILAVSGNVTGTASVAIAVTSAGTTSLSISGSCTAGSGAGITINSAGATVTVGSVAGAAGVAGATIITCTSFTVTGATTSGTVGAGATIAAGSGIFNTATGGTSGNGITVTGGTVTVTTATGGSTTGAGVAVSGGAATVTNATGGSGSGAHGVSLTSAGTATVTTAKGGSVQGALGLSVNGATATGNLNGTDLTGVGYPAGVVQGALKIAAGVKLQYQNASAALTKYYDPTLMPNGNTANQGGVVSGLSFGGGDFVGTRVDAPVDKVKTPTSYGDPSSPLIGTSTGGGKVIGG